jgi:hypothetical protein
MNDRWHCSRSQNTCLYPVGAAAILLGLSLAGCGKKEEGSGKIVTGKVTYNGQAVADATVTFVGVTNAAFGRTDSEGNFKLRTTTGEKVPVGDYKVTVMKTDAPVTPSEPTKPEDYRPPDPNAPPPPAPKDLLPPKYKDPATSMLTANVTESGENKFDFPLTD